MVAGGRSEGEGAVEPPQPSWGPTVAGGTCLKCFHRFILNLDDPSVLCCIIHVSYDLTIFMLLIKTFKFKLLAFHICFERFGSEQMSISHSSISSILL